MLEQAMNIKPPSGRLQAELVAGPPAASPPLFIALMLVALSIAAPFVFLRNGTPSLLLGITAVAVAIAGMITMLAAMRAQLRRRNDAAIRSRVSITAEGITFHPTPSPADDRHFARRHIASAHVTQYAFFVQADAAAPHPGRHALRFGKLVTPRSDIISALEALQAPTGGHPEELR